MTFRHPPNRRKSLGERFDDFCFFYAPGEECGRWHEADEDAPRGVRGVRCTGTMIEDVYYGRGKRAVICDTCGEIA